MRRFGSIGLAIGLCVGLAAEPASADGNSFVGRWHLSPAQSSMPAGKTLPEDVTLDVSRADATDVAWSLTVRRSAGSGQHVEAFNAPPDGQFRSMSSDTTAALRLSSGALEITFRDPVGNSDVMSCTVAADDQRMTCKGMMSGGHIPAMNYVDVFDRIPLPSAQQPR